MNRKYTLLVVLVAVGLVALAYSQRNATPVDLAKGTETPTPSPLFALDVKDIQEVDIAGAKDKLAVTRAAGGWQVDGQPADDQVDGVIGNLAKLVVTQRLGLDRKPEDYGFNTPSLTVTLKPATGAPKVFHVGDDAPGDPGFAYIRLDEGDKQILVVGNPDLNTLKGWLTKKPVAPTATPGAAGTPGTPGKPEPAAVNPLPNVTVGTPAPAVATFQMPVLPGTTSTP